MSFNPLYFLAKEYQFKKKESNHINLYSENNGLVSNCEYEELQKVRIS
jgi:hypothetical protein